MDKVTWPGWENAALIGNGSFGTVYEIRRNHYGMEERAALKVISIPQSKSDIDELINDGYDVSSITARYESYLKDIVGEYSLMAQMKGHSNIVYCDDLDCIKHEDGIGWDIYIKMELLTALPKALPQDIPVDFVVKLGKDICRALITCKEHHIVHRDIKPQNIFVSRDGTYKLGDFGIAKTAERTTSGTKIGTYKYMAPEVYKSEPYGSAADVYSLGLVMYWLLNERRTPFLPLPPEVPTASMEDEARTRRFNGEALPTPAHGSPELQTIVLKACAYDPKDRFASAAEMLAALDELSPQAATPVPVGAAVAAGIVSTVDVVPPVSEQTAATASVFETPKDQDELTETTISAWRNRKQPIKKETAPKQSKKKTWILFAIIAVFAIVLGVLVWPKGNYYFEITPKPVVGNYRYLIHSNIPNIEDVSVDWELEAVCKNGEAVDAPTLNTLKDKSAVVEEGWDYTFTIVASCRHHGRTYKDSFVQSEPPLKSLEILDLPQKTEYQLGETIDLSGMSVDLTYSNGENFTISAEATTLSVVPEVLEEPGAQTITLQQGDKTVTFEITVTDPEAEKEKANAKAYAEAVALKDKKAYTEAKAMFEALGDYSDAKNQANTCQKALDDIAAKEDATAAQKATQNENSVPTGSGLTRGNLMVMLCNLSGHPTGAGSYSTNPFTDIDASQPFYHAVLWAAESGIASSSSDRFAPYAGVTRQEFATLLYRYTETFDISLPAVNEPTTFTDADSISAYARTAVDALYCAGIIDGYSDGSFGPHNLVSRAEASAIILRLSNISE